MSSAGYASGDKCCRGVKHNFPATSPTPQPTNWPEPGSPIVPHTRECCREERPVYRNPGEICHHRPALAEWMTANDHPSNCAELRQPPAILVCAAVLRLRNDGIGNHPDRSAHAAVH